MRTVCLEAGRRLGASAMLVIAVGRVVKVEGVAVVRGMERMVEGCAVKGVGAATARATRMELRVVPKAAVPWVTMRVAVIRAVMRAGVRVVAVMAKARKVVS